MNHAKWTQNKKHIQIKYFHLKRYWWDTDTRPVWYVGQSALLIEYKITARFFCFFFNAEIFAFCVHSSHTGVRHWSRFSRLSCQDSTSISHWGGLSSLGSLTASSRLSASSQLPRLTARAAGTHTCTILAWETWPTLHAAYATLQTSPCCCL